MSGPGDIGEDSALVEAGAEGWMPGGTGQEMGGGDVIAEQCLTHSGFTTEAPERNETIVLMPGFPGLVQEGGMGGELAILAPNPFLSPLRPSALESRRRWHSPPSSPSVGRAAKIARQHHPADRPPMPSSVQKRAVCDV